jgi:hypothetical protein
MLKARILYNDVEIESKSTNLLGIKPLAEKAGKLAQSLGEKITLEITGYKAKYNNGKSNRNHG